MFPLGVIRPTAGVPWSVNQRLPSGPAVTDLRKLLGFRPALNSVIVPTGAADALPAPAPDYELEVASAGLDRPLFTPAHFRRFVGRRAKIVTSKPVGNRVDFSGPIVTADETVVVIDDPHAGATPVPHALIKRAHLIYDASADFKRK